jgi:tetratricopeptide (TPR) repeat protein
MNRVIISGILALVMAAGLAAQKPKSKGEVEALQAAFNATTADARIDAAQKCLIKYADTEFKAILLNMIAEAYRAKGDSDNVIVYCERVLSESDKNNYQAMIMLAETYAQRTREFDLDKEDKLAKVDKYATSAIEILKTAPKPNPSVTDEQWTAAKKDYTAQAHQALGMGAMVRKKYDVAITEFKEAAEGGSSPDPASEVRLATAYDAAGKYDDALVILDKLMAKTDLNPTIRQYAQAERVRAMQGKGAVKPAAPPATAPPPAAAPPETKKP